MGSQVSDQPESQEHRWRRDHVGSDKRVTTKEIGKEDIDGRFETRWGVRVGFTGRGSQGLVSDQNWALGEQ